MAEIRVYVSTGLVGCKREEILEIDEDLTDSDIDAIARQWMDEEIEWGWKRVEKK